jgi:predicted membrane channel-forming protein YqfA (hemolysin III family)
MYFFALFLIGLVLPFILIKVNHSWISWIPSIILFLGAFAMYLKAEFFPGEGMADLGERIFFMMFGVSALGSIVGGLIVHLLRKK